MLTSCYRESFRLKTDNLMYFGILEKYLLRRPRPSVSLQMLEANTEQSEESIP